MSILPGPLPRTRYCVLHLGQKKIVGTPSGVTGLILAPHPLQAKMNRMSVSSAICSVISCFSSSSMADLSSASIIGAAATRRGSVITLSVITSRTSPSHFWEHTRRPAGPPPWGW